MYLLFAVANFVSSTLLFSIQMIVGKSLLPFFGGAPLIWSTSMMFFQLVLLAGYFYAHWVGNHLKPRMHAALHIGLLGVALFFVPIHFSFREVYQMRFGPYVTLWILLISAVAVPFFVLSATSPLMQRWFAALGTKHSKNPYTLYVASNLGSFLPLLLYPIFIEPKFALGVQKDILWTYGFYAFTLLIFLCAVVFMVIKRREVDLVHSAHRATQNQSEAQEAANALDVTASQEEALEPTGFQRFKWVVLSFIPSSLLLGVTLFVSDQMDVTPGPFFWVMPMILYFLSFTLVFSKKTWFRVSTSIQMMLAFTLVLVPYFLSNMKDLVLIYIAFHLLAFFWICMAGHGVLVEQKPQTRHLTSFYLHMSLGGALGGVFNSLVAPFLFRGIVEYPLMLLVAILVIPLQKRERLSKMAFYKEALVGGFFLIGITVVFILKLEMAYILGGLILWCIFAVSLLSHKPHAVATIFAIVTVGFFTKYYFNDSILFIKRDFFGTNMVTKSANNEYVYFMHGNTIHGKQKRVGDPYLPTTYYHPQGPLGEFFGATDPVSARWKVAAAGLGIGSMLAYKKDLQEWVYFEISPVVIDIASNDDYFGFVSRYQPRIEEVDARLGMEREPDAFFDLVVLDAYSSDNIPVHLLTSEAFDTYLAKLKTQGYIVANISNRRLDLLPVFAAVAQNKGLHAFYKKDDGDSSSKEENADRYASVWVVLGKGLSVQDVLGGLDGWRPLHNQNSFRMWTDDFSSIFSVIKFY
jgi:hypothetical protein